VGYSAREKLRAAARPSEWRVVGRKVLNRLQPGHRDQAEAWAADHAESLDDFANGIAADLWAEATTWADEFRASVRARRDAGELGSVPMGGPGDFRLLYFLTRHLRPAVVFETGVAAGFTSAAALHAIERNGTGTLYSSDLPYMGSAEAREEVGRVVDARLRDGWHLAIGGDRANFAELLPLIDHVDLLHYDSDKSTAGRRWALDALAPKLTASSVIVMDDIADNTFFRDWVTAAGHTPRVFHRGGSYYVGLVGL
jgi:predicted O-methyltransferase YrrM